MGDIRWRAPTARELMAGFGLGEHAEVISEFVDLIARGLHHQPRLRGGTRVRILALADERGLEAAYAVEVLDLRARPTGSWAVVPEGSLTDAPPLRLLDWLRSPRA